MNKEKLFKAIEESSYKIKKGDNGLPKRIQSAKNYVANKDLNEWAFSKLVATENFDIDYGSLAKPFFYSHNFINILEIKNAEFKSSVIDRFLQWSDTINYIDLRQKFASDQLNLKRFELLIHMDLLPKKILKNEEVFSKNQDEFLEGFRREVKEENNYRNRELVLKAKQKHGTKCFVCEFSFEDKYGIHGKDFIEIHHLIPIRNGVRNSTIEDVAPVCSNCHRMLHKGKVMLSIDYLKEIIALTKADFKSISVEEFNVRIDKSLDDSKNDRVISSKDLKTKIKKWK